MPIANTYIRSPYLAGNNFVTRDQIGKEVTYINQPKQLN